MTPSAPTRLFAFTLLGAALPAQLPVVLEEDRAATRLLFIHGVVKPAEVCIHYGRAPWRDAYAEAIGRKAAQRFRLGTGAWSTLDTNTELRLGGKRVPASVWYLGLQRDADAKWSLTLLDSAKVHRTRSTSGATRDLKPDIVVPCKLSTGGTPEPRLAVKLVPHATGPAGTATLTLAWGPVRAEVSMQMAVEVAAAPGEPAFAPFDETRVVKTASGLRYQELTPGAGASPTAQSTVKVHYVGWTLDGKKFDSSLARKQPAEFPLSAVIRGWTEGVQLMTPGAVFRFEIPSDLAYGARGVPGIPPNSTLVFWVQLISAR